MVQVARYYFVSSSLPPLAFGSIPEMSFKELRELISLNLTASDLAQFSLLLQPIDLHNVKALWLGFPLDENGTFSAKELEEALLIRDLLPSYLIDFIEAHESTLERLHFFPSLYASLYRQECRGFLKKYYAFEREVRLILVALRSKKTGRDIVRELQFEDITDPFIAEMIAQKDQPDYNPPLEYEELKAIFQTYYTDPNKLAAALARYRFDRIEEWGESDPFTLDSILSYAARLLIVESLTRGDREKASVIVEELSKYG